MPRRYVGLIKGAYNPKEIEKTVAQWWNKNQIYAKAKKHRRKGRKFYFLDGPPYVTNQPHVGTTWNKVMKDLVIRFRRMQGYDVRDQPGYDCHGLPIEVRVEEMLGVKTKKEIEEKIGVAHFIEECKKFAVKFEKIQAAIFKELGIWMDWDKPYLTYLDKYIESVWWTLKKVDERRLLNRGLRVVHWCPRCETALAGYEITDEYRVVRDPSIYVKFPVVGKKNEYILIWTTTPWTLPSNVAIMVHPEYTYARVEVKGEVLILAEARCNPIFGEMGLEYKVLETFPGRKLEELHYRPALLEEATLQSKIENAHRVVLSKEYVTLEEGTGCVHSAPGHGEEDFEVGLQYGLPIISPVDSTGNFTAEAGKYSGMYVKEANRAIIEDLRNKGLLLYEGVVDHKYPHCWRCKTPLLLRATDQWFIKVTEFKDKMLRENERVRWVPDWAGTRRFKDWLVGARDWVISRQRYWGVPLPFWLCEKCERREVFGSIKELKQRAITIPKKFELHKPWVDHVQLKCPCGGIMRRTPDVLDVWMDSGVASWASLSYPIVKSDFEAWWPADFIIEAHDQTRGWFYSQLGAGVAVFNRSPYKCVVMHGHVLDEKGQRMSKSLGNFIAPEEVIKKYGRDILRFYELQYTVWDDFSFSWSEVEEAQTSLSILWNIYNFAGTYMNLDKFDPVKRNVNLLWKHLRPEDKWILSRTQSLVKNTTSFLEDYYFHEAARALNAFIVEDLSRWYVRLIRRRTWIEKEDPDKLAAYASLYETLKTLLALMAPFTPFIVEKLYRELVKNAETRLPESIHLCAWPKPNLKWANPDLDAAMETVKELISTAYNARQKARLRIRWPVKEVLLVPSNAKAKKAAIMLKEVLQEQINSKELKVLSPRQKPAFVKVTVELNYATLGPRLRDKIVEVETLLKASDAQKLMAHITEKKAYRLKLKDGSYVELTLNDISFKEELPADIVMAESKQGRVYIDTARAPGLLAEALARELVRRTQVMRKEMGLRIEEHITLIVQPQEEETAKLLDETRNYVTTEVRAKRFQITSPRISAKPPHGAHEKDWNFEGEIIKIFVAK